MAASRIASGATGTASLSSALPLPAAPPLGSCVELAAALPPQRSPAGWRNGTANAANAYLWRGNVAQAGGFKVIQRFRTTRAWPATQRCFVGITATPATAPTDVEPSSLFNMIGVGYDAADANWQVMSNDGSGSATKYNTGIARPTSDAEVWEVAIFAKPNDTKVSVQFTAVFAGTTYLVAITDILSSTTDDAPARLPQRGRHVLDHRHRPDVDVHRDGRSRDGLTHPARVVGAGSILLEDGASHLLPESAGEGARPPLACASSAAGTLLAAALTRALPAGAGRAQLPGQPGPSVFAQAGLVHRPARRHARWRSRDVAALASGTASA
ncbi:MAG: hypothetical protein U0838_13100 [Chloroflexota bacterium]